MNALNQRTNERMPRHNELMNYYNLRMNAKKQWIRELHVI